MPEREYISRSGSPGGRRRPLSRNTRSNRRKSGPPPIILIAFFAIIAIVVVVLIVIFTGKGKKPDDGETTPSSSQISSSVSSQSALPSEPVSSVPEVSPSPSMPEQSDPVEAPEELGMVMKVGSSGFEYYNFNESAAQGYITMVAEAGEKLKGTAVLYDMIIPTSMDIMLPESYIEKHQINSQNQRKAIEEYFYPSINYMNPDVKTVSVFDALKLHCNEYLYFRTDHHWTQLGAYYAYVEFCKVKGIDPVPLEEFDKKEYPGFLGSFYSDSPNTAMENDPDTVEAYVAKANTSLYCPLSTEGQTLEGWPVIQDGTDYSAPNKYLIFIAGDQPYEEITNHDLSDGSSCVVVKESFGNAFVPFLVNHYQTIYVVDYREYTGSIVDLVKEKGAKDVIFLNNISMTRNESLVETIASRF